jgi:hypothetical protein
MDPWYMTDSEVSSMCIAQLQSYVCGGAGARLMSIGVWRMAGVCGVVSVLSEYQVCSLVWMHWVCVGSGRLRPSL